MLASAATNGSVVIWNLSRQVKSKQGNTFVITDLIVMNQNHHWPIPVIVKLIVMFLAEIKETGVCTRIQCVVNFQAVYIAVGRIWCWHLAVFYTHSGADFLLIPLVRICFRAYLKLPQTGHHTTQSIHCAIFITQTDKTEMKGSQRITQRRMCEKHVWREMKVLVLKVFAGW